MAVVKGKEKEAKVVRQTHRQRQALFTQKLIIEAARTLFLEQGYGLTSIEAIAEKAGVGVSTVYAIFGSKRGILKAIREEWHQQSGQRDIFQAALQNNDPTERLELAAHATRMQWETGAAMQAIYVHAAAVDSEAATELNTALAGRRANLSKFVAAMQPMLCSNLGLEQATAIFLALTHAELYRELVDEHGWTPDDYEHWLAQTLKQQLLPERL